MRRAPAQSLGSLLGHASAAAVSKPPRRALLLSGGRRSVGVHPRDDRQGAAAREALVDAHGGAELAVRYAGAHARQHVAHQRHGQPRVLFLHGLLFLCLRGRFVLVVARAARLLLELLPAQAGNDRGARPAHGCAHPGRAPRGRDPAQLERDPRRGPRAALPVDHGGARGRPRAPRSHDPRSARGSECAERAGPRRAPPHGRMSAPLATLTSS
eukprot:3634105-Rhodomonas_salina.1